MLETIMAKMLKKKLLPLGINVYKIETGYTQIGIPDLYIRTFNKDIWIELKEIKYWPKRNTTNIAIPFRPGQLNWIHSHKQLGGKVYLCATYEQEWYLFDDVRATYTQSEFLSLSIIPTNLKSIESDFLVYILDY